MKLPKNPLIILIPDFPGYFTQANTRTHDWMNALSYLAELDVALTAKGIKCKLLPIYTASELLYFFYNLKKTLSDFTILCINY